MSKTTDPRSIYISLPELAALLGISEWTIRYRYLPRTDFITSYRIGSRAVLFRRADVNAWIESHKVTP